MSIESIWEENNGVELGDRRKQEERVRNKRNETEQTEKTQVKSSFSRLFRLFPFVPYSLCFYYAEVEGSLKPQSLQFDEDILHFRFRHISRRINLDADVH